MSKLKNSIQSADLTISWTKTRDQVVTQCHSCYWWPGALPRPRHHGPRPQTGAAVQAAARQRASDSCYIMIMTSEIKDEQPFIVHCPHLSPSLYWNKSLISPDVRGAHRPTIIDWIHRHNHRYVNIILLSHDPLLSPAQSVWHQRHRPHWQRGLSGPLRRVWHRGGTNIKGRECIPFSSICFSMGWLLLAYLCSV